MMNDGPYRTRIMRMCPALVALGALTMLGVRCGWDAGVGPAPSIDLGRGMNLSRLEPATEGGWGGGPIEPWMFTTIKQGGFATVRLPVRWSAHAGASPPYVIDPVFLDRVTAVVRQARSAGLMVVLNMHHYEEIFSDPQGHRERFLALWQQIASHFRLYPDSLVFEVLNEPHDSLTPERWNGLFEDALAVIRGTNPERYVMVGTAGWGGVDAMDRLRLPSDGRLILTFHYYSPFEFTHQGAEWVSGADAWLGTSWGTSQDSAAVRRDFAVAAAWASRRGIPVFLGEFGAYYRGALDDRLEWTRFVAREAERRGFSWAYWEFDFGFGAYTDGQWNELHAALIP